MRATDLIQGLRRELDVFRACLDADLSTPIEHCGDWTLYDLADHLGGQNLWAAAAVTEGHGRYKAPPAPKDAAELVPWFEETSRILLETLDTDPATEAWTFHPPHTVGFWQRRRCLETLVHRWDAEHALGTAQPLAPEMAGEGVAEVLDTMAPRQITRGRAASPPHALRLLATDTDASWTYGPCEPVAEIAATAENLLLLLWNRRPDSHPAIIWRGDETAGRSVLAGPLTP